MSKRFNKTTSVIVAARGISLAVIVITMAGCGVAPVRHVPRVKAISPSGMATLSGSPPVDVKAGEASTNETSFGSVGVGRVMGRLSEWTEVTVGLVRTNLSARGAAITPGAPKALTVTMTKAEVSAIPLIGVSNGKIVLTATSPDGLNGTFEGSGSSMAPLGAVDGAVEDAIKKLLKDSAVDAYLRK